MITTNDIRRLLDEIEHLPYKPDHSSYMWLEDLLKEVERQDTTAIQIGIVKSPKIFEGEKL